MMRIILCILGLTLAQSKKISLDSLDYAEYPNRVASEAAVVEWGHAAILSAVDAVVAKFGQQTDHGAYFEVETALVYSIPLNGGDLTVNDKLENHEEVRGNMVMMSINNKNLSGVGMAKIAQNSGAVGLMVVNSEDSGHQEHIYSMEASPEEEELASTIDIPVIMVSLNSGNLISEGDDGNIPDRIRLYSADDRPFFEDVDGEPVVYLIHNFMTDAQCDQLIDQARGKTQPAKNNLLEGIDNKAKIQGVESVHLWKGLLKGAVGRELDEQIEQVTGFYPSHLSDYTVFKHKVGGSYGPHYDVVPGNFQLATITIFLNDVEGGELVYPRANPPIKIHPKKGTAVVHHNSQEENELVDLESLHGELKTQQEKWTAKRFVYMYPLSHTRRLILPILAAPSGRLPSFIYDLYDLMLEKFTPEQGEDFFNKFFMFLSFALVFGLANKIQSFFNKEKKDAVKKKEASNKAKKEASSKKNK